MAIAWYFKKDGLEHGPVGSDDLRLLASLGMLRPTDLVRKSEMTRWAHASALKGLFRAPVHPTGDVAKTRAALPSPLPQNNPPDIRETPTSVRSESTHWILYMTATAALFALAGGIYRFKIEPAGDIQATRSPAQPRWQSTTEPVLAAEVMDPLLLAISSESPFDRGLAFRQVRAVTLPQRIRPQVHQIICETLDNRQFASIWSRAARALGEVGSPADLPKLIPLIEQAPLETQCSAMATAMVLDPGAGVKYFEPRAADDQYSTVTIDALADWGVRCEPAALVMLQSPYRMCRYHALFLLKAFGTPKALAAIGNAKRTESDKNIAGAYGPTIDAIQSRNQ